MINFFKKNGYLIIRNFHSKKLISQIKKDIFEISYELYKKHHPQIKSKKYNSDKFDAFVLRAKYENLEEVSKSIYDACKKLRGFYQVMGNKKLLDLSAEIMNSNNIGLLPRGFGMRIDYPKDKYWKARLHQDYTSQLGSPNGIVMYTALRNVTQKLGPVVLYKGSHHYGVFPTKTDMNKVKKKITYDPYYIKINRSLFKKFKIKHLKINETDVGMFHFLLLHEIGFNSTDKIRWSLIHRVFDFSHPQAIKQNYMGGLMEGNIFNYKDNYRA